MNLKELKAQRAKLDEQIKAAERKGRYPWSVGPWKRSLRGTIIDDDLGAEVVDAMANRPERIANARLIASAPELYQMLEEVTEELREIIEDDGYPLSDYPVVQAEELLARVRGE